MKLKQKIKRITKKHLFRIGYCTKPSFIIIGAQKAGTTALYRILNEHPLIAGSSVKEIHFFDHAKTLTKANLNQYHSKFPLPAKLPARAITFEATPNYLSNKHAASMLYQYNPGLKFIAVLRNPAERALSTWSMFHHQRDPLTDVDYDPRTFREAIHQEMEIVQKSGVGQIKNVPLTYLPHGFYAQNLNRYLEFFPKNQLLILEHSRLITHFDDTIGQILNFLQLQQLRLENVLCHVRKVDNHEDYQKEMAILKEFFHPYNEDLFQLLGKRFDW